MKDFHYSAIVERDGRSFRYDYKDVCIQWVDTELGGVDVIDEAGLSREHWEDEETRNEYIDGWMADPLDAVAYML